MSVTDVSIMSNSRTKARTFWHRSPENAIKLYNRDTGRRWCVQRCTLAVVSMRSHNGHSIVCLITCTKGRWATPSVLITVFILPSPIPHFIAIPNLFIRSNGYPVTHILLHHPLFSLLHLTSVLRYQRVVPAPQQTHTDSSSVHNEPLRIST